jgi:Fur family peroxide stress response transcriptional regulator
MLPTLEEFLIQLRNKKFRLSKERLNTLKYLYENQCHPTAEQIYNVLNKDMPSLSKTTIYNTLNALVKIKAVRAISIQDNEIRYDIIVKNHGHFKCECCGTIFNFEISIDDFPSHSLEGFQINDRNVCFKGICPRCL